MTEAKKKQFTELKEMHPDTLLLFRCGDFYESYQEDAESASRILGITLTRDKAGDRQAGFISRKAINQSKQSLYYEHREI